MRHGCLLVCVCATKESAVVGWCTTEKQENQKGMASASTRTRRRHSAPCATSTAESSAAELCAWTMLPVRKTKKSSRVSMLLELLVNFFHSLSCYFLFDWFNRTCTEYVMCLLVPWGLGTGAPIIESPYGDSCPTEEAPESISRAVASLPPEQMFELMKQMKVSTRRDEYKSGQDVLTFVWFALVYEKFIKSVIVAYCHLHSLSPKK